MTHTELRVGNWVRTCKPSMPNEDVQVEDIYQVEAKGLIGYGSRLIEGAYRGFRMDCMFIIGIPLDADWLERFGYQVHDWYTRKIDLPLVFRSANEEDNAKEGWYFFLGEEDEKGVFFEYVHQLQNFYFALTGQELTYDATKHKPNPGTPGGA